MAQKVDPGKNKDGTKKMAAFLVGNTEDSWPGFPTKESTKEDVLVKYLKNSKTLLLVAVATLVPFGIVGLGIWKACEIYKKTKKK